MKDMARQDKTKTRQDKTGGGKSREGGQGERLRHGEYTHLLR